MAQNLLHSHMLERYADQVVLVNHGISAMGTAKEVLESEAFCQVFHRTGGGAV